MYDLWATNGMCPPTLIQEITWLPIFELKRVQLTPQGKVQTHFRSRPGVTHTIEYMDSLGGTADWEEFANNGSVTATNTASLFEDDFTANTSAGHQQPARDFIASSSMACRKAGGLCQDAWIFAPLAVGRQGRPRMSD